MSLLSDLTDRRAEFDGHFALAKALEDRMMLEDDSSIGSVVLSTRHINTIKSGLVVHLYNIVEALMTQSMHLLGTEIGNSNPRAWNSYSMKEWLRESLVSRITDGDEDARVKKAMLQIAPILGVEAPGPQRLKKPKGTWDDDVIAKFMGRVNIRLILDAAMHRRNRKLPQYGDKTPLKFLALRRNAIAHGLRTFEDGASDLQLSDIRILADTVLDYMVFVVEAFQKHIDDKAHLLPVV